MDRRSSLKGILGLSIISIFSFSAYRWYNFQKDLDLFTLNSYSALISELAETIIPETDTPGAKKAKVENYIINVITNCTPRLEQNIFLNGLRNVENYSLKSFGKSFLNCDSIEKSKILSYIEYKGIYSNQVVSKIIKKISGESFFLQLKQLTVEGYCQSEIGATHGLRYDFIPVIFESCIPLKLGQKSWATK